VNASVILKCLTGLFFLGVGVYSLAIALLPSWRDKSSRHWKFLSAAGLAGFCSNSWLTQLGFAKGPGDWDDKTANHLFLSLGLVFSLVGIEVILLVVRVLMA